MASKLVKIQARMEEGTRMVVCNHAEKCKSSNHGIWPTEYSCEHSQPHKNTKDLASYTVALLAPNFHILDEAEAQLETPSCTEEGVCLGSSHGHLHPRVSVVVKCVPVSG